MEKVKVVVADSESVRPDGLPSRPSTPGPSGPPAVVGTPMSAPMAPPAGWTVPTPSAPWPTHEPVRRADEAPTEPTAVLDRLVADVEGVSGAVLASVDGFGLAHSRSMVDEPSHPAMLAAAVGLAHQLVAMGGGETLRQLVVDHDAGLLLVWPIGAERVLAVLAASRVDQRALRAAVQRHAGTLLGASA